MVKAAEIAGIDRVACFAHILHNSVKKALANSDDLNGLVKKCHGLAKFFHQSSKMAAALVTQQEQLDASIEAVVIIMDVVTRWNSTLHMTRRLCRVRIAIEMVFEELSVSDKLVHEKLLPLMLKESEWDIVEELVKVLEQVENMTLIFSSASKGIAASLYPWVAMVKDELTGIKDLSELVGAFRQDLLQELNERHKWTDLILTASVFHPSFNIILRALDNDRFISTKQHVQEEYDRLIRPNDDPAQQIQNIPSTETPQDQGSAIHRFLKRQRTVLGDVAQSNDRQDNEVERYFAHSLVDDVVNPMEWWRFNKEKYPVLAKMARKYLAIPATSVASERMFSVSGGVCTDKRGRLSDYAISDIVFCNYASKCLAQVAAAM